MLEIKCFTVNPVGENCYIVSDETKEAVIIDNGAFSAEEHEWMDNYIKKKGLTLKHALCTHGHFDHAFGWAHTYKTYNLKPEMNHRDAELYNNMPMQIKSIMGGSILVSLAPVGTMLRENDIIAFGKTQFKVIETPGHTPGGICLYCETEKVLFTGDSLFEESIGRTDFPGGSYRDLISSLKSKIMTLPQDTGVYPGHGYPTSIGHEAKNNPFLK